MLIRLKEINNILMTWQKNYIFIENTTKKGFRQGQGREMFLNMQKALDPLAFLTMMLNPMCPPSLALHSDIFLQ